jgi:ribonuclease HI
MAHTPLAPSVLLKPATKGDELEEAGRLNYQAMVGSIIYASIMTRPDVAKAAAVLSRFSHNPGRAHERAAKHCIRYLYGTRFLALQADGSSNQFECFSDAAFADDPDDRKSSQGYLMQLFGLPIHWKAGRQDTVTTSSTEAELLALSSAAKEQQAMSRLFRDIELDLTKSLQLLCDNLQTIRLLKEETARLHTKLKHVDVHRHWLRQEVQQQRIQLEWVPTHGMAADGLTKVLTRPKHSRFLDQLGMISLEGLVKSLEAQEDAKDEGTGADARADPNVWLTG